MKFLYPENQDFKKTGVLFSEEEVRSHIDHYFQDSRYYFQSFVDRKPLARRPALLLAVISTPIVVWAGLSFRQHLDFENRVLETALSCGVFGVFLIVGLMGWVGVLQSPSVPDDQGEGYEEKSKDKQKFVVQRGTTKRDMAYDHLLKTGVLYEGKIAEIVKLTATVRQISFHFGSKTTIQSGVFVTESSVELEPYETLMVLSDGFFAVLI